MKEVLEVKYLRDFLSFDLEDSVQKTVIRRLGVASHAAYKLGTIIEDTRAAKIGGINIAFQISETSIVPMLMHNSETWDNIEMHLSWLWDIKGRILGKVTKIGIENRINMIAKKYLVH